jgi:hypothetical protein
LLALLRPCRCRAPIRGKLDAIDKFFDGVTDEREGFVADVTAESSGRTTVLKLPPTLCPTKTMLFRGASRAFPRCIQIKDSTRISQICRHSSRNRQGHGESKERRAARRAFMQAPFLAGRWRTRDIRRYIF